MDKQTLSNYGWVIILTLVLAVMIALATPFGTYVGDGVVSIVRGYTQTSDTVIDEENISAKSQQWENKLNDTDNSPNPALNPTDGVWEGSRTTPQNDDIYETTDYTYTFDSSSNGWWVLVKDTTKTSYEPILESINGEPVTNMEHTFEYCESLTTAPTIPSGVTDMYSAFRGCISLTTAPIIPDSVTNMSSTFYGCTSLTTAPTIPNGVTIMEGTFYDCTSLTGTITINANPTPYTDCLYNCGNSTHTITLTGSSTKLTQIKNTAGSGHTTYITIS